MVTFEMPLTGLPPTSDIAPEAAAGVGESIVFSSAVILGLDPRIYERCPDDRDLRPAAEAAAGIEGKPPVPHAVILGLDPRIYQRRLEKRARGPAAGLQTSVDPRVKPEDDDRRGERQIVRLRRRPLVGSTP